MDKLDKDIEEMFIKHCKAYQNGAEFEEVMHYYIPEIKALIQEEVKERDKLIADIKEVRKNKEGYIFEVVLIRIDELITKYEERG